MRFINIKIIKNHLQGKYFSSILGLAKFTFGETGLILKPFIINILYRRHALTVGSNSLIGIYVGQCFDWTSSNGLSQRVFTIRSDSIQGPFCKSCTVDIREVWRCCANTVCSRYIFTIVFSNIFSWLLFKLVLRHQKTSFTIGLNSQPK
jgi:hypothetical protein